MEIIEGIAYHPAIKTAVMFDSGTKLFEEKDLKAVSVDNYKIAPWGTDNNFPLEVRNLIEFVIEFVIDHSNRKIKRK